MAAQHNIASILDQILANNVPLNTNFNFMTDDEKMAFALFRPGSFYDWVMGNDEALRNWYSLLNPTESLAVWLRQIWLEADKFKQQTGNL